MPNSLNRWPGRRSEGGKVWRAVYGICQNTGEGHGLNTVATMPGQHRLLHASQYPMNYTVHLRGDDGVWKPEPRLCKDCCHSIADARDAVRQMHANGIAAFFHRDARIYDSDGNLVDEILFPSPHLSVVLLDGNPAPNWWARLVATIEDMTNAERMVAVGIASGIAAYLASIHSPQAPRAEDISRQLGAGMIDCQAAAFTLDDLTDDHP